MHLAAAQLLVVGVLPGGHLHQRGAAQIHARALADEDIVVAHPRLVRAARRRAAEHDRDRRDALAGETCDVAEEAPALGEVRELSAHLRVRVVRAPPEVAAGGLDELDIGEAVQPRDLERPVDLLEGDGGDGPAEDGRVVAADDALDAGHDPEPRREPAADGEVGAPAGERTQLEKGRVAVEQELDALADEELAALPMAGHALLAAAALGQGKLRLDFRQEGEHVLSIPVEALGARVDARPNDVHGVCPGDDDSPAPRRQSIPWPIRA